LAQGDHYRVLTDDRTEGGNWISRRSKENSGGGDQKDAPRRAPGEKGRTGEKDKGKKITGNPTYKKISLEIKDRPQTKREGKRREMDRGGWKYYSPYFNTDMKGREKDILIEKAGRAEG